jgi:glycosyltransferase involved in cell wall biosynthesis
VPAVTSNTSCLPEIAGDGALLVDPQSPAEIGSALSRLLDNAELRRRLGAAGAALASRYRWAECARASFAFFERALSSSPWS